MSDKRRAKDSDLGELHVNYIAHLKSKLKGEDDGIELTTAEHAAIRNVLKDNQIFVETDIDNESEHKDTINLTMADVRVMPSDLHRQA